MLWHIAGLGSKLSRVEAGEIPLSKLADLEALLNEYGVTEPEDRDVLLQMQRDSLKSEPLTTFRNTLPCVNTGYGAHPQFARPLEVLREAGTRVLYGPGGFVPNEPGGGDPEAFP